MNAAAEETAEKDTRSAGSFGAPAENVDATGRRIRPEESPETDNTGTQKNLTKEEERALDDANDQLKSFKEGGHTLSAQYLDHYLNGPLNEKGEKDDMVLPAEIFDSNAVYRRSTQKNRKRIEDSIVKGAVDFKEEWHANVARTQSRPSPLKDQLLHMKDGESIILQDPDVREAGDRWDADIGRYEAIMNDYDSGMAIGAVKLKTLSTVKAVRKGDTVEITGDIRHIIDDIYDFNNDTLLDKQAFKRYRLLEKRRLAKPFRIYGEKTETVRGRVKIRDGKITDHDFHWQDKAKDKPH